VTVFKSVVLEIELSIDSAFELMIDWQLSMMTNNLSHFYGLFQQDTMPATSTLMNWKSCVRSGHWSVSVWIQPNGASMYSRIREVQQILLHILRC